MKQSSYEILLAKYKRLMRERQLLQMNNHYYKNRCKELEAERKVYKRMLGQLGMLLDVKIEKIRSDVK